jgi:hypothetical protein
LHSAASAAECKTYRRQCGEREPEGSLYLDTATPKALQVARVRVVGTFSVGERASSLARAQILLPNAAGLDGILKQMESNKGDD